MNYIFYKCNGFDELLNIKFNLSINNKKRVISKTSPDYSLLQLLRTSYFTINLCVIVLESVLTLKK